MTLRRGSQIGINNGNMKAHGEVCLLGIELLQFGPNGSDVLNGRSHDCTIANSTWLAR